MRPTFTAFKVVSYGALFTVVAAVYLLCII